MTDPSALDRLSTYFQTTPIVICLWICAIALGVIFAIGFGCVKATEEIPEAEGTKKR